MDHDSVIGCSQQTTKRGCLAVRYGAFSVHDQYAARHSDTGGLSHGRSVEEGCTWRQAPLLSIVAIPELLQPLRLSATISAVALVMHLTSPFSWLGHQVESWLVL
jgi:hypothetical protein